MFTRREPNVRMSSEEVPGQSRFRRPDRGVQMVYDSPAESGAQRGAEAASVGASAAIDDEAAVRIPGALRVRETCP